MNWCANLPADAVMAVVLVHRTENVEAATIRLRRTDAV
jgi:hypothetical protein